MKLYKNLKEAVKEREEVQALKITLKIDQPFPPELFFFPNLEELYLEGDCKDIPRLGTPWSKLRSLSIKWPSFSGDLAQILSLPSLKNLKIIETPIQRLLFPIGFAVAPLESLTLKQCSLELLPEEISMFQGLKELNLTANKLSKLPRSFPSLARLQRLNLDQNLFSKFPDVVKSMPSLSHLSIDGNDFSEEEKERIQREHHIWL